MRNEPIVFHNGDGQEALISQGGGGLLLIFVLSKYSVSWGDNLCRKINFHQNTGSMGNHMNGIVVRGFLFKLSTFIPCLALLAGSFITHIKHGYNPKCLHNQMYIHQFSHQSNTLFPVMVSCCCAVPSLPSADFKPFLSRIASCIVTVTFGRFLILDCSVKS